jgi:hypothetical protein
MSQIVTLPNIMLRPSSLVIPKARDAGRQAEQSYIDQLIEFYGNSITALWRRDDMGSVAFDAGPNRLNGVNVGATPQQSDIPWSGYPPVAMEYDGATRFTNIYSTELSALFNGSEGSLIVPVKISPAAWTDGVGRYIVSLWVNSSNRVELRKDSINNQVFSQYVAGGVGKTLSKTSFSPLNFFLMTTTWSAALDRNVLYINNALVNNASTLGVWAGSLSSTGCCIGALNTTPSNVHSGLIGPACLLNRAAQPWEVAQTYAKFIQALGGM